VVGEVGTNCVGKVDGNGVVDVEGDVEG